MTSQMNKCPSMTSVHSMVGVGRLPPGHGYVPHKEAPDKPYGPSFISVMNRMWRGKGKKYIHYAIACMCLAVLFIVGGAVYMGHRNVSRMMVKNTEVLGPFMIAVAILLVGGFFHFMYRANQESNKWRSYIRFKPEGLYTAAAYNYAYVTEDDFKMETGTYGPHAIKELARPSRQKSRGRSGMLKSGAMTPRSGLQTPATDLQTPRSGLQTPRSGLQTPKADKRDEYGGYSRPYQPPGGAKYEDDIPPSSKPSFEDKTQTMSSTLSRQVNLPIASQSSESRESEFKEPEPSQEVKKELPPVVRTPAVLPPVHRQPVTSKKTNQSLAFNN